MKRVIRREIRINRTATAVPGEKRQLLNFVLSNCVWKDNALKATFKKPFETISEYIVQSNNERAVGVASNGSFSNWLPGPDSNQRPDG